MLGQERLPSTLPVHRTSGIGPPVRMPHVPQVSQASQVPQVPLATEVPQVPLATEATGEPDISLQGI